MKLSRFHLNAATWGEASYPYPSTIAEAMFLDTESAIVGVDPEHTSDGALITGLPEGWQLDFATGGKKHGVFIVTRGGSPVGESFWATVEEAVDRFTLSAYCTAKARLRQTWAAYPNPSYDENAAPTTKPEPLAAPEARSFFGCLICTRPCTRPLSGAVGLQ